MRARLWLRLKIGAGHVVRAEPDELDFQDGISRTSKSPSVLSVNDRVSPRAGADAPLSTFSRIR